MEHFVPIRKADLVDLLCHEPNLAPRDRDSLRRLAGLLSIRLHMAYHGELEQLKQVYAHFDPDSDTLAPAVMSPEERAEQLDEMFRRFDWLLQRANFMRLTKEDICRAMEGRSAWGVNLAVDFEVFERLEIYARGDVVVERKKRGWRGRLRGEHVAVEIWQRLVIIFRLRSHCKSGRYVDTDDVFMKVFKDIPKLDLEMLLPGTQVQMTLLDRAKILLPTLSGLGIAVWKVLQGALLAATAGVYGLMAVLGLISGTLGYGVKSFYGYLRTKEKYQLNLTESLYYQNLDNNAGVLFHLMDDAEEQEHREVLLGYFFLWRDAPAGGWTSAELDHAIEVYLAAKVGRPVDFEVGDALDKLERMQLVQRFADNRLRAVPLSRALTLLESLGEGPAALQRAA
jgi:hypothetical protein